MTKGSYAVGDNSQNPPRKDNSFRSFICVLLIFLGICLIILLATINWSKSSGEPNKGGHISDVNHEELSSDRKNEKINLWERLTTIPNYKETDIDDVKYDKPRIVSVKPMTESGEEWDLIPAQTTVKPPTSTLMSTTSTQEATTDSNTRQIDTKDAFGVSSTRLATSTSQTTTTEDATTHTLQPYLILEMETTDVTTTVKPSTSTLISTTSTQGTTTDSNTTPIDTKDASGVSSTRLATSTSQATTTEKDATTGDVTSPESEASSSKQSTVPKKITTVEESTTLTSQAEDSTVTEDSETGSTQISSVTTQSESETQGISSLSSSKSTEKSPSTLVTKTSTISDHSTTSITSKTTSSESKSTKLEVGQLSITPLPLLKTSTDPICRESVCNETAIRMLSLMNHTADPCEDFYQFACGGINHLNEETDDLLLEELLNQVESVHTELYIKKLRTFYYSCLDYEEDFKYVERLQKVEELIEDVGQFHFQNATEELPYNLTDLVTKLILRQSMPLFDVSVDVNKQSSDIMLQLTLPEQSYLRTSLKKWSGLTLHKEKCLKKQKAELRGTYLNLDHIYKLYTDCHGNYQNYIDSVERVIRQLDSFKSLTDEDKLTEIKSITFSIEFEILDKLTTFLAPGEVLYKFINKEYEVIKISDLQVYYPVLNWQMLFETLVGREIPTNATVQVYFRKYFNEVFKSLGKMEFRVLNNVFLSIFANDLFMNTVLPKEKVNREQYCSDLSKTLMPDIWASLVESSISPKEKNDQDTMITNLFKQLKNNFCKSLQNVDWLIDAEQLRFVKKCNSLNLALFTPPDEEAVINNNQDLNITGDYQTDLITSLVHYRQSVYSTVGTPFSDKVIFSYFLDPMSKTALSSYSTNLIATPVGLIKKVPNGLPDYLTMARVGLHLARQIARHFDPTGIRHWIKLDPTAEATYSELISTTTPPLYPSSPRLFDHKNISFSLNGSHSTNEKIVDNSAFRLILDSYNFSGVSEKLPWISTTYSKKHIFYVAVAQEFCQKTTILDFMLEVAERRHLPAVLRVENIMINSEQFSEEFVCSDGAGMNLISEDRRQFPYIPLAEPADNYD